MTHQHLFSLFTVLIAGGAGACAFDDPATSPGTPGTLPASCLDVRYGNPAATDGEYTLHHDRSSDRPWVAYCHGMATSPEEYISLSGDGATANQSTMRVFGPDGHAAVSTRYERVRIDPRTLMVDVADKTFATSSGTAQASAGYEVTSVPFGVAAACTTNAQVTTSGRAIIDLSGTEFVVTSGFCVAKADEVASIAWTSFGGRRVDLEVFTKSAEACASAAPDPCLAAPYSDAGGFRLQLAYQP